MMQIKQLSSDETPESLYEYWLTLDKEGRRTLTNTIKFYVEQKIYDNDVLLKFNNLKRSKDDKEKTEKSTKKSNTKYEFDSQNGKDREVLNQYLLQISNNIILKRGFSDKEFDDMYIVKKNNQEIERKSITNFSSLFWIRLSNILGMDIKGKKYWKQKYSYRLALETLKRNPQIVQFYLNRNINNISHLENIFLKIIKENAKLTLDAMMLELQQKKKEEVILQKDFEEQETIEEIREKFRKRAEHLTVTKKHIFEDELLNE